jgi:hypothetical protein
MAEIVYRSQAQAGLAVRGQARRIIRALAHSLGLKLDLEEEKGCLDSLFLITVTGEEAQTERFRRQLLDLL